MADAQSSNIYKPVGKLPVVELLSAAVIPRQIMGNCNHALKMLELLAAIKNGSVVRLVDSTKTLEFVQLCALERPKAEYEALRKINSNSRCISESQRYIANYQREIDHCKTRNAKYEHEISTYMESQSAPCTDEKYGEFIQLLGMGSLPQLPPGTEIIKPNNYAIVAALSSILILKCSGYQCECDDVLDCIVYTFPDEVLMRLVLYFQSRGKTSVCDYDIMRTCKRLSKPDGDCKLLYPKIQYYLLSTRRINELRELIDCNTKRIRTCEKENAELNKTIAADEELLLYNQKPERIDEMLCKRLIERALKSYRLKQIWIIPHIMKYYSNFGNVEIIVQQQLQERAQILIYRSARKIDRTADMSHPDFVACMKVARAEQVRIADIAKALFK